MTLEHALLLAFVCVCVGACLGFLFFAIFRAGHD